MAFMLHRTRFLSRLFGHTKNFRNYGTEYCTELAQKGVVLGLYEKEGKCGDIRFTSRGENFDKNLDGKLMEYVRNTGMDGRIGQARVFNGLDKEFNSVCVVGVGKEGVGYCELEALDEGMENTRIAAGIGARKLRDEGCIYIYVDPMEYPEQAAEGSSLAAWRYQENKNCKDRHLVPRLELYDSEEQDAWTRGLFKADAQNLARTLTDAPPNQITPHAFAQTALDVLCPCGIGVEAYDIDWIETQRMGSFLAVAKSSCEAPMFLELSYCGDLNNDRPILLAGSGITYNSGGLSLTNECTHLLEDRGSIAGAAIVIAVIRAAASLSLPINIIGVIPLCENMPSGMAFKPGDVLTTYSGQTIAVHHPYNVHRLCLSDALMYGQKTHKPRLVIDVTSACKSCNDVLGGGATAVFSSSDYVWSQLRKAGSITGDRVWRLPLWNYFSKQVTDFSNVDLSNKGHGEGQPCLAAAFIKEFISCVDFIHLDVNGTAKLKNGVGLPYLENDRMTGRPTRTLIQLLHQLACPEEAARDMNEMN